MLLGGLVRGGLVRVTNDEFEKDGKRIEFRRASLTPSGRSAAVSALAQVKLQAGEIETPKAGRKKGAKTKPHSNEKPTQAGGILAASLREWRLGEARRRGVPAFRILTDRVLNAIAEERPATTAALMRVNGMGPKLVEQYGRRVLDLCSKP